MNDWVLKTQEVRCNCLASDAWRCAMARQVIDSIACHCACHRYAFEPPERKEPERLKEEVATDE